MALQFEELSSSSNKSSLATALVDEYAKMDPELTKHKKKFREFLVRLMESDEYRNGKAQGYMRLFSENELKLLIALVQSPAYAIMQSKRNEMSIMLMQNMIGLTQKHIPEFRKAIRQKNSP